MTLDLTVPDLTGKLAIVTGASDGLGRVLAGRLAAAGAELVLPVRDLAKAERTLAHVHHKTLRRADLASLDDVAGFAQSVDRPVHLLVNNAGIMAPPARQTSRDGLELQFATNHLSHFALVHHLLPRLKEGRARVTSVVSFGARDGRIAWDDLQSGRDYRPMRAYNQSKLAQLLFALELDRRSTGNGWGITSNAAHPGLASTNLQARTPLDRWFKRLSRAGVLVQTAEQGVRPTVYAVSSPHARGGAFYGPGGLAHLTGAPAEQRPYRSARSAQDAERIWAVSEELVG
ncbi:SDR family oxidoreductase [Dactylosporangium sp. NPDC049525]|uniref:SDR family oxidoreductase n=1 Tax=Dactylosporangium sp. NPDC049525 TaxID=3154730 RepID=UPI00342198A9